MPKLSAWIMGFAALAAMDVTGGARAVGLAAVGTPPPAEEGVEVEASLFPDEGTPLQRLDHVLNAGLLEPKDAAALLFSEGPEATKEVLKAVDERAASRRGSGRPDPLDDVLIKVPAVAVAILDLPDLEDGSAYRAAAVSLVVLEHRGLRAGGLVTLEAVLQRVGSRPGASVLGRHVQAVIKSVAANNALDGSDLLGLVRAAGAGLATDVLQSAATGLAGDSLAYCLHKKTGLDGTILNQLQRSLQLGADVRGDQVAVTVVPFLDSDLPFERSEAALVLGRIGGRDHVRPLISALEDDSKLVRTSTLSALRSLTGMTIGGDGHRWRLWYEKQRAWWTQEGQSLVASLRVVPRTRLVKTLTAVATKRLYRDEISEQLVTMLDRQDTNEVRAVVAALGALRDPDSVSDLVRLRGHPVAAVRSSVESALQSMRHSGIGRRRAIREPALW